MGRKPTHTEEDMLSETHLEADKQPSELPGVVKAVGSESGRVAAELGEGKGRSVRWLASCR